MKKSAVIIIISALICSVLMTSCGEDKTQQSSVNQTSVVSSDTGELSENSKDEKSEVSEISEVSENSKNEKSDVDESSLSQISETVESITEEISDYAQVSSVQQIFEIPKAVENFDKIADSLSNDTVTTRIFPEGDDTIVIELTAASEITGDSDMINAGLDTIIEDGKSQLSQAAKTLEENMPNLGSVKLSVRFYNPDGTFLYSKEITSDMNDEDDEDIDLSDYEDDEDIPEISIPVIGNYGSLKELFEENYEYFNSLEKANTNEMMETSIFLTDDDKTLVFLFQIKAELNEEQTSQLGDILVDSISESFPDSLLQDLNEAAGEECSIVIRVVDKDYYQLFEQKLN